MTPDRIASLPARMLALDTETYRIVPGLLAPRLVLGSIGWLAPGPRVEGALLTKHQVAEAAVRVLQDPDAILATANGAYDLLVIAVHFAALDVDIMPLIFAALEQGRIYDLQLAEALHAIAEGTLGRDPRTGGELKNPETGKRGRYSLATCVDLTLGRADAKANDAYRLRYDELDDVPLEQLPQAARDYPVDDVRNTGECTLAQTGHLPKTRPHHDWSTIPGPDGKMHGACAACGATRATATCFVREPHRNLHELANQVYSAFALHCGAAWGFAVNQDAVDVVERHAVRKRERTIGPFVAAGIFRAADGTQDRAVLKRLVAIAYGATEPCPHCAGTGQVPKAEQRTLQCPDCRGRCAPWKCGGTLRAPTVASCARCASTGRVPHPTIEMRACIGPDDEMTCDGTGLVLTDDVPRSKAEGISFGRDTLHESGDELLMSLGDFEEDAKILKDYIPFLRTARVPVAGHLPECNFLNEKKTKGKRCHCPGPYRDIPLTLRPNPILETQRVSYDGYIMLLPRAPGFVDPETGEYVPSIRECIVARGARGGHEGHGARGGHEGHAGNGGHGVHDGHGERGEHEGNEGHGGHGTRYEVVEVPDWYVLQPGEERVDVAADRAAAGAADIAPDRAAAGAAGVAVDAVDAAEAAVSIAANIVAEHAVHITVGHVAC